MPISFIGYGPIGNLQSPIGNLVLTSRRYGPIGNRQSPIGNRHCLAHLAEGRYNDAFLNPECKDRWRDPATLSLECWFFPVISHNFATIGLKFQVLSLRL